jgi:hypothetical protein
VRDIRMPAPAKPKKTRKNQPVNFNEVLSPAFMPAAPLASASPSPNAAKLKVALWIIWPAAVILGGIGIGRLIVASTSAPQRAAAPAPVATAHVAVAPTTNSAALVLPSAAAPASPIAITPSTAVNQAQAGSPFQTASIAIFQPTAITLQPGFATFGSIQGKLGTNPVN